jgi:hypothetical protein
MDRCGYHLKILWSCPIKRNNQRAPKAAGVIEARGSETLVLSETLSNKFPAGLLEQEGKSFRVYSLR